MVAYRGVSTWPAPQRWPEIKRLPTVIVVLVDCTQALFEGFELSRKGCTLSLDWKRI